MTAHPAEMPNVFSGDEGDRTLSQALFDALFRDMDQALRQMGVGDLGVPHHMKRMMKAYKGRALAYDAALADPALMEGALRRNLFGAAAVPPPETLAWFGAYACRSWESLAAQPSAALLDGTVFFEELDDEKEKSGNSDSRMVA